MEDFVWHYAPWAYLPEMVSDGRLKTSNAGASNELPMLWFSANQHWDPTATKLMHTRLGQVRLTFAQQASQFGCIRFGLPADDSRLLNWGDACHAAKTSRENRRQMERLGRKLGAKPAHWFATVSDINLSELRFQVWLPEYFWQPAKPVEMAEVWKEHRANLQVLE